MILAETCLFLIAGFMNEKRHSGNFDNEDDFDVDDLQIFMGIWVRRK